MFLLMPEPTSFIIQDTNERVKIGHSVMVRKSLEEEGVYLALVVAIRNERKGLKVGIRLYCTPEETLGGRRSFHGNKEILLLSELEFISAHLIQRKCFVYSCVNYARLKHVGPYDYFSRFEYQIGSGTLSPDQVNVFCYCEMPFNPDQFMLKCQDCKELYHPACINMADDEAKQVCSFTCDECRSLDVNQASSSADPVLLETLKQQLEEQARADEELVKAAEEWERAEVERKQAAARARAAEERERAAKERKQATEERKRAVQKRIKELEEQVKESANMMITLKALPLPPQYDEAKEIDSFRREERRAIDVNQASVSASADPSMVQPSKRAKW